MWGFGGMIRRSCCLRMLRRLSVAASLIALLAGCAGAGLPFSNAEQADAGESRRFAAIRLPNRQTPITEPVQRALDALSDGNYAAANRGFASALNRDSRNASLHAMNALTYHLRVRGGERDLFELAETGYLVSLEQRRDYFPTALQLARLYYENGHYGQAKRAAVYALDIEPDNLEALQMMAASAYYDGDIQLSLWAVEEARKLEPADRQVAAMRPLVYGAAGLDADARSALNDGAEAGLLDRRRQTRMQRRIDQWRGLYHEAQATQPDTPPPPAAAPRASVTPAPLSVPPLPSNLKDDAAAPPAALPGQAVDLNATPQPPATAAEPPKDEGALSYAWWDCQQQLNQTATGATSGGYSGSTSYSGYGSVSADETTVLPALPAPCRGRVLPRMAMIDAVILRTDDVRRTGSGVNLLDNLQIFLSGSLATQKTWGTSATTVTNTLNRGIGLGTGAGSVLTYSLNIANATDQRAEVLARPSLLALDRQAAQFFSGSTISVALISSQGGGNLEEKPVGVSLSVTPTFIDDESMLVSVKAVRSFFENTVATATFGESVQTSRNMVTAYARLRFDETMILSGLSERENTSTSSRTPFLGDLPGLQYLFSRKDNEDFTRSVIVLLTPRRVANLNDTVAGLEKTAAAEAGQDPEMVRQIRQKALKELGGVWPNLPIALRQMDRNRLFRAARTGDMEIDGWEVPSRIEQMLNDLVGLIYN